MIISLTSKKNEELLWEIQRTDVWMSVKPIERTNISKAKEDSCNMLHFYPHQWEILVVSHQAENHQVCFCNIFSSLSKNFLRLHVSQNDEDENERSLFLSLLRLATIINYNNHFLSISCWHYRLKARSYGLLTQLVRPEYDSQKGT